MGGIIHHSISSVIFFFFVYFIYVIFDKEEFYEEKHLLKIDKSKGIKRIYHKIIYHKILVYCFSLIVGHLSVDLFKFGISATVQKKINIFQIEKNILYNNINKFTSNFLNWLGIGFLFFLVIQYLYKKHIIDKRSFFEFDGIIIYFLLGVLSHLILDLIIFEKGVWF